MTKPEKAWPYTETAGIEAVAQEEYPGADESHNPRISKLSFLLILAATAALVAFVIPNVLGMMKG